MEPSKDFFVWLQHEVPEWAEHNFPGSSREIVVLGLAEETGELCRAALKRYQGIRGTAEEWDAEARKEIGDVFIKLVHVAHVWGFDLVQVVQDRWREVRTRDWVANPQGHGLPDYTEGSSILP